MHTHFGALGALQAFFSVLVLGTLWRLLAAHMVTSNYPLLQELGKGMAFQY
jgi:hypothetical protein